ncbi:hypothetical protein J6TS7_60810 [Paenibacillus dendritiformis]|nr:hypothetical protein J6TS7_60810 [Paenibacillus dendritiformis]
MKESVTIQQPPSYGPLGHLPLIDKNNPTLSLCKLCIASLPKSGKYLRLAFFAN